MARSGDIHGRMLIPRVSPGRVTAESFVSQSGATLPDPGAHAAGEGRSPFYSALPSVEKEDALICYERMLG